ncbi:type II toxin-antitoxin system HicB family antitoxin [Candidatus Amarolinea dominans]|uniref:type II toxin-antitoxin system HicB family antitoxin n=1 Tax=Candidatus Amarolinea dominans TaxID=3140696 RepID=UPI0031CCB82D
MRLRCRLSCAEVFEGVSQGETEAEALRNIQEAIQLCLDVRRAQGLPLTIESRQIEAPIYA